MILFRTFQRYGAKQRLFNALAAAIMFTLATLPGRVEAETVTIAAFGDSLTAGFGLAEEDAFPARLQATLAAAGLSVKVVNAGVSGDTTAAGLARLDWMLADAPDLVIVELGANDGLRGLDPAKTFDNLDAILARLRADKTEVVLTGMFAPPNLGTEFGDAFKNIFPRLAKDYGVVFYPFFLDGVAGRPALNQADGIHPNAAGVDVIVERITPYITTALERLESR